jgi:ABC-2 type transport system permease protein
VVILPILAIFFGQMFGVLLVNRELVLAFAGIILLIDAGLIMLSIRLFQRETILTRWK